VELNRTLAAEGSRLILVCNSRSVLLGSPSAVSSGWTDARLPLPFMKPVPTSVTNIEPERTDRERTDRARSELLDLIDCARLLVEEWIDAVRLRTESLRNEELSDDLHDAVPSRKEELADDELECKDCFRLVAGVFKRDCVLLHAEWPCCAAIDFS
jgi:hypothetical protein